ILRHCKPKSLAGIDPSPEQIPYVSKYLSDSIFQVADSAAIPFGDGSFDIVASALVIHFIPDRARAFTEMKRVLQAGGLVGGYTWKRSASGDFSAYAPVTRAAKQIGAETVSSPTVPESSQEGMRAS